MAMEELQLWRDILLPEIKLDHFALEDSDFRALGPSRRSITFSLHT